jgi:hypothetical protein
MAVSAIFERASQQWRDMRSDFERHTDAAYDKALDACGGVLVNAAGRRQHVDGYDLFTGPAVKAYRFASEELVDFWEANPRLSMNDFEAQWVEGNLEEAA